MGLRWTKKHGKSFFGYKNHVNADAIHDCEYAIGSVNFTGDMPVILTRDGPSLGGFVCPVTIVKAELWKVGQAKPGHRIRFRPMTFDDALALEKAQDEAIAYLAPLEVLPPETGGPASYVELLSCVEILRDARNIRNADPLESDNESVSMRRSRDNGRPVRARRRHPT